MAQLRMRYYMYRRDNFRKPKQINGWQNKSCLADLQKLYLINFRIADPTKRLENVLACVILSIGILHGFLINSAAIAVGV
jgi:hypothetical protein